MISLDTNIVLRFLLDDVPEQTIRATQLVMGQNKVYVTDVVVMEVFFVLERVIELSRKDSVKLVHGFLRFGNVVHNPYFLLDAIKLYEEKPSLSIVDCYAAAEANAYSNQLYTFDKRLATQGGTHVKLA